MWPRREPLGTVVVEVKRARGGRERGGGGRVIIAVTIVVTSLMTNYKTLRH